MHKRSVIMTSVFVMILMICMTGFGMKKENELPDMEWQIEASFPDWKGYVDDTLAMNGMASFYGYHGQGRLYVCLADGVTGFRMYVNSSEVDTSSMCGGETYVVDFSEAAVNGRNTVQVSGIEPGNLTDAVRVYIPCPEVTEGTPAEEGISESSLSLISDIIDSDIQNGFTSAQLSVIRHGRLVYENAWGNTNAYLPDGTTNPDSVPVTTETLYDLRS